MSSAYPLTSNIEVVGTGGLPGQIDLSDGTNSVQVRAPTGLAGNVDFTLPTTVGTTGFFLSRTGPTSTGWATTGLAVGLNTWYVFDVKSEGSDGGSFFQDAWRQRDLNSLTKPVGTGTDVQLAVSPATTNQMLITDGTYYVFGIVPGKEVDQHKARLYNVTDAATALLGTSSDSGSNQVNSTIMGYLIVSGGPKVFEIEHYSLNTREDDGFGLATGISGISELYTIINFIKLAT